MLALPCWLPESEGSLLWISWGEPPFECGYPKETWEPSSPDCSPFQLPGKGTMGILTCPSTHHPEEHVTSWWESASLRGSHSPAAQDLASAHCPVSAVPLSGLTCRATPDGQGLCTPPHTPPAELLLCTQAKPTSPDGDRSAECPPQAHRAPWKGDQLVMVTSAPTIHQGRRVLVKAGVQMDRNSLPKGQKMGTSDGSSRESGEMGWALASSQERGLPSTPTRPPLPEQAQQSLE